MDGYIHGWGVGGRWGAGAEGNRLCVSEREFTDKGYFSGFIAVDQYATCGYLNWIGNFLPGGWVDTYTCGVLVEGGAQAPKGNRHSFSERELRIKAISRD